MAKKKSRNTVNSFSPDGHYFAILSPDGSSVKIWSTKDHNLLAEWNTSHCDEGISYSCLALSVSMKKRRKRSSCLLAIGSSDGKVLAVDALSGETKWARSESHLSGLIGLAFVDGANSLYAVSTEGIVVRINSENGEIVRNFKVAERPISFVAFSYDQKVIVLYDSELRVVSLESEQELVKLPDDMGPLYDISISDAAKTILTCGRKNTYLLIWQCDASCTLGRPKKIKVKTAETNIENRESAEKNLSSIISAKLRQEGGLLAVIISHGSVDSPEFILVNVSDIGDGIVMTAAHGDAAIQERVPLEEASTQDINSKKKRAASDSDIATEDAVGSGQRESFDGGLVEDDLDEPTMGEKLEKLNLLNSEEKILREKEGPSPLAQLPSADSVNVLLRQALHADDRALLLDCLYTQDEKVITNSVSLLSPPDVHKLLQYLISVVQSRGAVVACALPWLRRLLLQHASGIIAQESSFTALNSLYQLIESRVSTFQPAIQLSSCLSLLYAGVFEEGEDEETVKPVIYEDKDESEEEESSDEDAMEVDQDSEGEELTGVLSDGFGDVEIDGMSD